MKVSSVENVLIYKPLMIAISIFVIVIGGLFLFMTFKSFFKAYQTTKFTSVNGEITRSDVSREGAGLYAGGRTFKWNVSYKFTVNHNEYTGNTVDIGSKSCIDENVAQGVIDKYPIAKNVQVFYNENDPNQSCLEPGIVWYNYLFLLVGPLICFFGFIVMYFFGINSNKDEADYMEQYKKANKR